MKKFLLMLLCILTCFQFLIFPLDIKNSYSYESTYLRVTNDKTPFYSNVEKGEILFYLPYTYYVKLISKGEIFDHVEYYGSDGVSLDGYVPNETLFTETQSVSSPYPKVTITTTSTIILYEDSSLTKSLRYIFSGRTLTYFGTFTMLDNTVCFYVSYGGQLGYVKEVGISPFTIENHPNPLTFIKAEEPNPPLTEEFESDNVETLRILIIACLILAGLFGLVIAFKKPRTQKAVNVGYYDENDFE